MYFVFGTAFKTVSITSQGVVEKYMHWRSDAGWEGYLGWLHFQLVLPRYKGLCWEPLIVRWSTGNQIQAPAIVIKK